MVCSALGRSIRFLGSEKVFTRAWGMGSLPSWGFSGDREGSVGSEWGELRAFVAAPWYCPL